MAPNRWLCSSISGTCLCICGVSRCWSLPYIPHIFGVRLARKDSIEVTLIQVQQLESTSSPLLDTETFWLVLLRTFIRKLLASKSIHTSECTPWVVRNFISDAFIRRTKFLFIPLLLTENCTWNYEFRTESRCTLFSKDHDGGDDDDESVGWHGGIRRKKRIHLWVGLLVGWLFIHQRTTKRPEKLRNGKWIVGSKTAHSLWVFFSPRGTRRHVH